jgi:hypothetical protein
MMGAFAGEINREPFQIFFLSNRAHRSFTA